MRRVICFSGSVRKGSFNQKLADHMADLLEARDAEVERLTLLDYPLPIFNQDLEATGTPPEVATLAQKFAQSDAVFIASPEYNGGVSGLTKNTIDWLSRQKFGQFRRAVFGLGAVSSGKYGGIVGISHLRDTLNKIGALVAPTQLAVGPAADAFDDMGALVDAVMTKRAEQLADQLLSISRG